MIYVFRKEIKKWHSVLWVVFAALALSGLSGIIFYRSRHPRDIVIASVNGDPISLKKFQQELSKINSHMENLRRYARAQNIPPDLFLTLYGFSNPRQNALDSCVHQKLLDGVQSGRTFQLDDEYFNTVLLENVPSYVLNPDGTVNGKVYKQYLAQMRMTIAEYEDSLEDAERRALLQGLIENAYYVPDFQILDDLEAQHSKKKFKYLNLDLNAFLEQAKSAGVTKEKLAECYDKNVSTYRIPEKRMASYWPVNSEDFMAKVSVTDAAIERNYERYKNDLYRIPPRVKLRRIFISKDAEDETKGDEITAFSRAQQLRAQAESNPDGFADLAKKNSQDKQTASKGGLVDFFDKGTYDKAFERAAFRLTKVGEISPVVSTKDGYEILQLVERISASSKPLALVRDEIVKGLKAKKALREMGFEVKTLIKNVKKDEKALDEFVTSLKLQKQATQLLSRKEAGDQDLISKIAKAMYDPGMKAGSVGYVQHGDDYFVFKIDKTVESSVPELSTLEKTVKQAYFNEEAKKAQKKALKELKSEFFVNNVPLEDLAKKYNAKIETTDLLDADASTVDSKAKVALQQAFALTSPEQLFSTLDGENYYVIQLVETKLDQEAAQEKSKQVGSEEFERRKKTFLEGFIASLTRTAKIEKNEQILRASAAIEV